MKLIIAYVKPERFKEVKKELYRAEISRMSVSKSRGCGQQGGFTEVFRATTEEVTLLPKVRIEIAVNDSFVERAIEAIIKGAKTGDVGDGKIFVLPLEDCIRIRTDERGIKAVGGGSKELELEMKSKGKKGG